MKLLTTAAMALALTGAAAAAQADQPQNNQNQAQHQGHQGGGQPHGQGGQPNYKAAPHNAGAGPQAGQHGFAGPQGVQQRGGAGFSGQANVQTQQGYGRYRGAPGAGGQVNGQVQQWNGQRAGAHVGDQGELRQWQAQRGAAGVQPNGQVQRWNGQPGRYAGQAGARAGFGFQSHALRGRDQGRAYFNANSFARQYHAQRRFRFGGYRAWPSGWYLRSWSFGDFLPMGWFAPQYYLDWADYGLPPPPVGCEWIAQGPDAVLVDIWTGEVLSVYQGVFYWNGY